MHVSRKPFIVHGIASAQAQQATGNEHVSMHTLAFIMDIRCQSPLLADCGRSQRLSVRPFLSNKQVWLWSAPRSRTFSCSVAFLGGIDSYNWSRQAVTNVVGTFWDKLAEYQEAQRAKTHADVLVPPGWEVVTLIVPTALVERFRAEIAAFASGSGDEHKRVTEQ